MSGWVRWGRCLGTALVLCALAPRPAWAAESPRMLALLVGIDRYDEAPNAVPEERFGRLQGAHNDVTAMSDVLAERGFHANDIMELRDAQATGPTILAAITYHLGQAEPDDVAVFYFSGHGDQVPDQADAPDEQDGYDEAIVPWDNRGVLDGTGHLIDDQLQDALGALRASNVVVIVDAGHATAGVRGTGARGGRSADRPPPEESRGAEEDVGPGLMPAGEAMKRGTVLLGATRPGEPALEATFGAAGEPPQSMGVFTYLLVQEIRKARPEYTWRTLADRVRMGMRTLGHVQRPQAAGDADRRMFNGTWQADAGYFVAAVSQDGRELHAIGGGRLHGLDVGDRLAVLPIDADPTRRPLRTIGTASLRRVDLSRSEAELDGGRTLPFDAVERGVKLVREASRVPLYEPRLDASGAPTDVQQTLGDPDGVALLPAGTSSLRPADLELTTSNGRVKVERIAAGQALAVPDDCAAKVVHAVSSSDAPTLRSRLAQTVELDRVRTRLEGLANDHLSARLDVSFSIRRVKAHYDSAKGDVVDAVLGPPEQTDSEWTLRGGDRFQFVVSNNNPRPVHVGIVELRADGGIAALHPLRQAVRTGKRKAAVIPPGKDHVAPDVFEVDRKQVGQVGWKLIASYKPLHLDPVIDSVKCRDGTRRSPGDPVGSPRSAAPMSELDMLIRDLATSLRTRAALRPRRTGAWGTAVAYGRFLPAPTDQPEP